MVRDLQQNTMNLFLMKALMYIWCIINTILIVNNHIIKRCLSVDEQPIKCVCIYQSKIKQKSLYNIVFIEIP